MRSLAALTPAALLLSAAAHAPPRIELDLHGTHEAPVPVSDNSGATSSGQQYPQVSVSAGAGACTIPQVVALINSGKSTA
jgi:hypothetical protein